MRRVAARRLSTAITVALVLGVGAFVGPTAHATPSSWPPAARLSDSAEDAASVDSALAADAHSAVVVWATSTGVVRASRWHDLTWDAPTTLATTDGYVVQVKSSADGSTALAMWWSGYAVVHVAWWRNGQWEQPTTLRERPIGLGTFLTGADLAMSRDGSHAVVVWTYMAEASGFFTAATTWDGSSWSELQRWPSVLTAPARVAVSADGSTAVVTSTAATEQSGISAVFAVRWSSGGWAAPQTLMIAPAASVKVAAVSLALSGDGSTVLVGLTRTRIGPFARTCAVVLNCDTTYGLMWQRASKWSKPMWLNTAPNRAPSAMVVALNASATNGLAVYTDDATNVLVGSRVWVQWWTATQGAVHVSARQVLSPSGELATAPAVALSDTGDVATLAWTARMRGANSGTGIDTAHFVGGAWHATGVIAGVPLAGSRPSVAADLTGGHVSVCWVAGSGLSHPVLATVGDFAAAP